MNIKTIYTEITCLDCKTTFPTSERCFKDRQPYCRSCIAKKVQEKRNQTLEENRVLKNSIPEKICKKCNTLKNIEEFEVAKFKDTYRPEYIRNICRACNDQSKREYYQYKKDNNISLSLNKSYDKYLKSLYNKIFNRNKIATITFEDLLDIYAKQEGRCNLSGEILTFNKNNQSTNISIDRIDSNIGYEKGNIQLVCHYANIMKWNKSVDELKIWCEKILNYKK